jgi:GR25 family glycosyltransferase involved in LPS biosynthesis
MNTIQLSVISIFIFFILFFLINRDIFIIYSNTVLGKLLAIIFIILSSKIHISLGLFNLIIILSYYKIYGYDSWSIYQGNDFLDGIDSIYWINLERSKDRKNKMEEMFQDSIFFNKPIIRIEAIDGKKENVYDKLDIKTKKNNKLEYACLLSHLKAIKTFSESMHNTALIFEDDITLEFKKYWKRSLRTIIDNAPSDWEIIQLCYITSGTLISEYTLNNYKKNQYGNIASMAAYIINNKAAKKFINESYNNVTEKYTLKDYHTHEADHYLYKCFKTYTYKYPYFIYPTDNTSTLHPEDLNSHVRSKIKQEQMYSKMKNGVFL